jgi:RNA recognition motif-containing protein
VTDDDLRKEFSPAGNVVSAQVARYPDSQRSKGWGIVQFATPQAAEQAIKTLNNKLLRERPVNVRLDREPADGADAPLGSVKRIPPNRRPAPTNSAPAASTGASRGGSSSNRRVYVGNLAWDVAWQDLKDFMREAGEVVRADVLSDKRTHRSKGCGIVEYSAPEEAARAISQLNNREFHGRNVFIREDREDKKFDNPAGGNFDFPSGSGSFGGNHQGSSTKVSVSNLSHGTSWQQLKDAFKAAGEVVRADVDPKNRGNGTVTFGSLSDAQNAVATLNGTMVDGHSITVRLA